MIASGQGANKILYCDIQEWEDQLIQRKTNRKILWSATLNVTQVSYAQRNIFAYVTKSIISIPNSRFLEKCQLGEIEMNS